MVKLHPQLKKKLMKLYDPSGQGFIDFHAFTRFVMGSAPGAGTSYGNEEPTDPQRSDTLIHKRWEPEQVEAWAELNEKEENDDDEGEAFPLPFLLLVQKSARQGAGVGRLSGRVRGCGCAD